MASYKLHMPQMGESIHEATVLRWMVEEGAHINQDDIILEVATDKVDSEIPSPVTGNVKNLYVSEGEVVNVGAVIAHIETDEDPDEGLGTIELQDPAKQTQEEEKAVPSEVEMKQSQNLGSNVPRTESSDDNGSTPDPGDKMMDSEGRFFSPLVRTIAEKENISTAELRSISGTGAGGKVTKSDILAYLDRRSHQVSTSGEVSQPDGLAEVFQSDAMRISSNTDLEEVVNMSRVRHTIAQHMIKSRDTAAHVTSVMEADMTDIVNWRNRNKKLFQQKYGVKLTYTPVFVNILAGLLREFPYLNSSVQDNQVILKKYINIGIATALEDHTLIVPVVKNADEYNLVGIAKTAYDLITRARQGALKPDEIRQGTFTITNIGTFGNLMGTPIINQPQVAILATGAIVKRPAVIETQDGDFIGIRHKMYLSLSYDHRIIDGYLGGTFLKALVEKLERFDEDDL